uniref:Uncharacterized protein n=1 Tax=Avena sativa TaxID=4498 RepID=A0ACD5ZPY5_AVESA
MKILLILTLLTVAVTSVVAQLQTGFGQQQFPQHALNPCKVFLLQQCIPLAMPPFVWSQMLDQSTCQVMRQQCCQQLAQIPAPVRCPAICNLAHTIIVQQQIRRGVFQPEMQQPGQTQQVGQFEAMRSIALRTLPTMCHLYMPSYCTAAATTMPGCSMGGY